MRFWVSIGMLAVAATAARAQPSDPYGPTPPQQSPPQQPPSATPETPPTPADPVLAEQVAQALVARAQELYDAKVYVDAKQLAVEALVRSPKGTAADQAKMLIKQINQQLGIKDEDSEPKPDLSPIEDPTAQKAPIPPQPEGPQRLSKLPARVHGALYAGLLGATVGSFFSHDNPAAGAVPSGIVTGAAAALFVPRIFDRMKWNDAQVRTLGASTVWGGVVGGLIADIGKLQNTNVWQVLVGSSIGATVAGAGGFFLAREDRFTTGDVALMDTFAGLGAVGGLTIGMLMQPAETEAYSLNSIFGIGGGLIVGMIAAPQTNTTPRRMLRVAGLSAAGGALPFLLYAGIHDSSSHADERVTGLLSSIGLVGGAWLGFYLTRNLDRDKDVLPNKHHSEDDPPLALVSHGARSGWQVGALAIQPLAPQLSSQRGMAVPLLGGSW